jgi:hypothetical integral membrane protein (TIGR02206 family)
VFEAYSTSHLVVLAGFVVGVVVLLAVGSRVRGRSGERPIAVALAVGNIGFGIAGTATELLPFEVEGSLPLQICDFAWVAVAWALLTRHRVALALSYYWGLTLALQALVQPTLDEAFPDPNFFAFWGKHVLLVWGAVFATLTLRQGPGWQGYRQAVLWTSVWVAAVMCLNPVLGSNYGYFNGKPSDGTILDYLGPWPWYVVMEVAIVLVGWALLTLPWTGLPRAPEPPDRRTSSPSTSRRP